MPGFMKVLVTGSSELPEKHVAIARELGRSLMTETSFALVTGGLSSKEPYQRLALDRVVADAAAEGLHNDPQATQQRIMTILPDPTTRPG